MRAIPLIFSCLALNSVSSSGVPPKLEQLADVLKRVYIGGIRRFLNMEDGRYVLPEMDGVDLVPAMNSVNFTSVLSAVIEEDEIDILKWLLSMKKGGEYVLPGMDRVDFTEALSIAIKENRMEIVRFLLKMNDGGGIMSCPE